ncbi:DNA-binding HxlR family transcriptional regulator [Bacillus ectoiniformans]|uniref:YkyA family protein n=1 Tax=Bacillus ectoiniformans TaxID=1494429 RepID=UPI00195C6F91|nr:DNA-binding HxlR family transcriptional regulator [Bacillus ectoiniformans]
MKKIVRVTLGFGIFLLAGCGGTPEEKAKEIIEKTRSAEEQRVHTQISMSKLESKEKGIFEELMRIDADSTDQLKEAAKKGRENVTERQEKMKDEQQAMDQAAKEFAELKEVVPDIEDSALKKRLNQMQKHMAERNKAHKEITQLYAETTEINLALYDALQQKDTKFKQVKSYIAKLNEKNKDLQAAHKTFNKLTKEFNEQKKVLYVEK